MQKFGSAAMAAVCSLAAAVGFGAYAQEPPFWRQMSTAAQVEAAYPPEARAKRTGGIAWVECTLAQDGSLRLCAKSTERPRNAGFGEAALGLVSTWRGPPDLAGRTVIVPIQFGQEQDRPSRDLRFKRPERRFAWLEPAGPYWPDAALRAGVGGKAVLDCRVDEVGRLRDCAPLRYSSHPMFVEAALRMAERDWMTAADAPTASMPPPDNVWRFTVQFPPKKHPWVP